MGTKAVMVRAPEDVYGRLAERARRLERPVAWVALKLIEEGLGRPVVDARAVGSDVRPMAAARAAAKSPCSHSPVLVRNGRCTECGEAKP